MGIEKATGIVWNITGGDDLTLHEVSPSLLAARALPAPCCSAAAGGSQVSNPCGRRPPPHTRSTGHAAERQACEVLCRLGCSLQVNAAAEIIYDLVDPNANLIFGAVIDPAVPHGEVSITLIATGFDHGGSGGSGLAASQQRSGSQPQVDSMAAGMDHMPQARPVVVERPNQQAARVHTDVPTGTFEVPAFLRKRGMRK